VLGTNGEVELDGVMLVMAIAVVASPRCLWRSRSATPHASLQSHDV
jgi:hypothetical protein